MDNRKRYRWLAKACWWVATTAARWARQAEGLSFNVGPAPGFEFDKTSYWWDLCQDNEFRAAVQAIANAEERKCLNIMAAQAQAATGRPVERWQEVAASAAAAAMFRELPMLFAAYAARWVKQSKRKAVNADANDTANVGR